MFRRRSDKDPSNFQGVVREMEMEETIADTIVWMAEERVKGEGGDGDLVRAIYSVWMEVDGKVVKMPALDGKVWDEVPI